MSLKLPLSMQLKKGDKKVVTIEDAINDCVVVSMIYQNRKFYGALMDASKRKGPHGISDNDEVEPSTSIDAPFPQPLLTRQSFKQDIVQPPLPKVSRKWRKCRRKMGNIANGNNVSKLFKKKQVYSNSSNKSNRVLQVSRTSNKPKVSNTALGKRKAVNSKLKHRKIQNTSIADGHSTDTQGTLASPVKYLIPQKEPQEAWASPVKHFIPQKEHTYTSSADKIPKIMLEPDNIVYENKASTFSDCIQQLSLNGFKSYVIDLDTECQRILGPTNTFDNESTLKIMEVSGKKGDQEVECNYMEHDSTLKIMEVSGKKGDQEVECNYMEHDSTLKIMEVSGKKGDQEVECNYMEYDSSAHNKFPKKLETKSSSQFPTAKEKIPEIKSPFVALKYPYDCLESELPVFPCCDSDTAPPENPTNDTSAQDITSKHIVNVKNSSSLKRNKRTEKSLNGINNNGRHTIYVTSCKSVDGVTYTQGDIVWSKLSGYPWWPSHIVKLIVTKTNGASLHQEAMVAWFHSNSTSILPLSCLQMFEEHFNTRFEKRRRGVYQKAVADAQKAVKKITPEVRKLISQFET